MHTYIVRNINTEYDRLVVQLGGVVVQPGKERKRATAANEKPSKVKLRKEDILFEAAIYLRALMDELDTVKNSIQWSVHIIIIWTWHYVRTFALHLVQG